MINRQSQNQINGVNERAQPFASQLSPGSGVVEDQANHGRQPVTGMIRKRLLLLLLNTSLGQYCYSEKKEVYISYIFIS
jgi:hypothetical protein